MRHPVFVSFWRLLLVFSSIYVNSCPSTVCMLFYVILTKSLIVINEMFKMFWHQNCI